MTLTFIDSGVLIAAARGRGSIAENALKILEDPDRQFASSIFLKLEVLPKAIFNHQSAEARFYEEYFDAVTYWATVTDSLIDDAYQAAVTFGLGAMDALHIVAAISVGATEFITNEKPEKSIHRAKNISIISIQTE